MASPLRNVVRSAQFRLGGAATAREGAAAAVSLAAIVLPGVILQRLLNIPILPYACIAGGISALAVVLYRLRFPHPLAAAAELDRQFHLNESISTALQISGSDDDAFRCAARSEGEQAARRIAPAELNPGSWGQWRWLAALIMLGIAPAIYRPVTSPGETISLSATGQARDAQGPETHPPTAIIPTRRQAQAPQGESTSATIAQRTEDVDSTGRPAPRASRGESAGASPGGGFAQGYAAPDQPQPLAVVRMPRDRSRNATTAGDASGAGTIAPGTGTARSAGTVQNATQASATRQGPSGSSTVGQSPDVEDIPADYREIVKAYYRR